MKALLVICLVYSALEELFLYYIKKKKKTCCPLDFTQAPKSFEELGKYCPLFHTGHFQTECEFEGKRKMSSLLVSVKESFHADVITLFLHFVGPDIKSKAFSFFSENERRAE